MPPRLPPADPVTPGGHVSADTAGPSPAVDPASAGFPTLPPDCPYRVEAFVAAGGLGRVFRAIDNLGRPVALKVLHRGRRTCADTLRRFRREAEVTARLERPGIAPVYGTVVLDGGATVAYAMRLIEGETLREAARCVHAAGGVHAPAFRSLLQAFVAVCRTVGHAHRNGIVHRDLKPANLMVDAAGMAWVLDWGLAKFAGRDEAADPEATARGELIGTPAFMAPEQATADPTVGPAADVYALGGVLFYLLTGRPPHGGATAADVMAHAVLGAAPPVRRLNPAAPPALAALCRRALSRRPADRPRTADMLADAVERYLSRGVPRRPVARLLAGVVGVGVLCAATHTRCPDPPAVVATLADPLAGFRPADPAWSAAFLALPVAEQVRRVEAEMKRRNPGFAGPLKPGPHIDRVAVLWLCPDDVTDLGPLAAFAHLTEFTATATHHGSSLLADVSPLRPMKLKYLNLWGTAVADLNPLRDMPLHELVVGVTPVASLEPLRGKRLRVLDCGRTQVTDLGPLRGMPLRRLLCNDIRVTSFEPLRGAPLHELVATDGPALRAVIDHLPSLTRVNGQPVAEFRTTKSP